MRVRFSSVVSKPEGFLVAGLVLAVSAAGNSFLGGPDVLVGALGLSAALCIGATITLAAIQYESGQAG